MNVKINFDKRFHGLLLKNIFIITLLLAFLFSIESKTQLDTLNYLKQFEANKAKLYWIAFFKAIK